MNGYDLIMYEEEFRKIDEELQKLRHQSNAKVLFLTDKNGQLIASSGLVRLSVKKATEVLANIFNDLRDTAECRQTGSY
jgi:putative ribosome biogenesis GTPase RsgA